ncbi:hypothetical protein STXM2123_5539 [Streptomyces sp. F-3]|nr:hypothetical protein STXM2123_5539 [Streptomyces sp. F-3]
MSRQRPAGAFPRLPDVLAASWRHRWCRGDTAAVLTAPGPRRSPHTRHDGHRAHVMPLTAYGP